MKAQQGFKYVSENGDLTLEGMRLFNAIDKRLTACEARLAAIAAVVAPVGGATNDAEARAAVTAIIAGAA